MALDAFSWTWIIAARCCLLVAWSMMLLVLWLLEPAINYLEKLFIPTMLPLCFLQASHPSRSTNHLLSLSTSHHGHNNNWYSPSCSACHFWEVVAVTCLFVFLLVELGAQVLTALDSTSCWPFGIAKHLHVIETRLLISGHINICNK